MKHARSVHIDANAYEAIRDKQENIKVLIGTFFHEELIGFFYTPVSTYKLGYKAFNEAIKSRAKRDLGITFDHHSSCGY